MRSDPDAVRDAMMAKSDDELRLVVTVNRADYQEAAIRAARAELHRRGVDSVGSDAAAEAQQRVEAKRLKEMSSRWIYIYAGLIALFATLGLIQAGSSVIQRGVLTPGLALAASMAGLHITTAIGLFMRHRWAWNLNWLCLAGWVLVSVWEFSHLGGIAGVIGGTIFGGIWSVPNALYFKKRRHMFAGTPTVGAEGDRG